MMNRAEIDLSKAPDKGMIYALYRDKKVFRKYEKATTEVALEGLLELHIFDDKKEYRVINSEVYGFIEHVALDDDPDMEKYEEIILCENGHKVKVVNYITYNEMDLIEINDYRLEEVK